jgi:hypothetical protein
LRGDDFAAARLTGGAKRHLLSAVRPSLRFVEAVFSDDQPFGCRSPIGRSSFAAFEVDRLVFTVGLVFMVWSAWYASAALLLCSSEALFTNRRHKPSRFVAFPAAAYREPRVLLPWKCTVCFCALASK